MAVVYGLLKLCDIFMYIRCSRSNIILTSLCIGCFMLSLLTYSIA